MTKHYATVNKNMFRESLVSSAKICSKFIKIEPKEKKFTNPLLILGTVGDNEGYRFYDKERAVYPNAPSHLFTGSGGHHFMFLHPEEYSNKILEFLEQTDGNE